MALPIIDTLADDVARLTWAGALAARGDERLAVNGRSLAGLGAQVPALARTATLVEKVVTGDLPDAGAALLALNGALLQIRAAQAAPAAPSGELAAIGPSTDEIAPRAARVGVIYPVIDALTSKKKPADAIVNLLLGPDLARDPRLWSPLVRGLAHPYLGDAAVAALKGVGPPVLPSLEASFNMKGKTADARRLRAIGDIRGRAGEAFYRECLDKGSKEVRGTALGCLAGIDPVEMESLVVSAYESAGSDDEREVFLDALVRVGTRRTLTLLLDLAERRPGCASAIETMNDDALQIVLDLAKAQLSRVTANDPEGTGRFVASYPFRRALVRRDVARGWADAIPFLEFALRLPNLGISVKSGVADLLLEHTHPNAARVLFDAGFDDDGLAPRTVKALFRLGQAKAFEVLAPLVPRPAARTGGTGLLARVAKFFGSGGGDAGPSSDQIDSRVVHGILELTPASDSRWVPLLLDFLAVDLNLATHGLVAIRAEAAVGPLIGILWGRGPEGRYAAHALGELGATAAVGALVDVLEACEIRDEAIGLVTALGKIGDPRARPALERVADRTDIDSFQRSCATRALEMLRSP